MNQLRFFTRRPGVDRRQPMCLLSRHNRALISLGAAAALLLGFAVPPALWALDGVILGADEQPLSNAWVSVFSASPRDGQKSTIPIKHYPECGRFTRTDAEGRFVFADLNKDLLYRLLVSAPGHRPEFIREADPQFGGAQLRLQRLRVTNAPADRRITARIIDPEGRPVRGARIEVNGYRGPQSSYNSNLGSRVDPMAVSDEKGGFAIHCGSDITGLSVSIEGARVARRRLWLTPGEAHLIRLHTGATVSGRLVDAQQKPVPASLLNLETEDQSSATLMRGFEVSTDAAGRFEFTHMPAETKFRMQTPAKEVEILSGGLVARTITTGTNDSVLALGDLAMSPAHFMRGRVVLKDGQVVPDRSRITMSFDSSTPSRTSTLDPEGWFEFAGVLGGPVSLQVQIQGYRISARNPNKDLLSEGRLVGVLQSDHEQFLIELEPAKGPARSVPANSRPPRDKPLRSATLE